MRSDRLLLGLDVGTTNVKAVVATSDGRVLAEAASPVQLYHVAAGGVEQDIEELFRATLTVVRRAAGQVDPLWISAVGVSSQGGALQIIGEQGQPIGRVISWLDRRGAPFDEALTAELGREWFVRRIGHGRSGLAIGQLLRLRHECPALLCPPQRIGFVGDTIVGRLCGYSAHDGTSCGLTLLYNPSRRVTDPELLERLGLPESSLPSLLSPRQAAGGLRPDIARETGLPEGIPVSVAVHDQYAAALATGSVHAGDVMFGAGTAWVLLAVSEQLTAPVIDDAFTCTHVVEGLHGQILSLVNGGSAFAWALQLLRLEHERPEEIDRLMEEVPAGSDGLCFWPLLAPLGAAGLPPGTRGRLLGIELSHRPAHVLRAVVEGLACELARYLRFLLDAGMRVDRLIMCGQAGASRVTPQIMADVTNLPVACTVHSHASALGAAVIARGLLEPDRPLDQLAEAMALPTRQVLPGSAAVVYAKLRQQYMVSLSANQV
jgi:sugar (pentulose or hexulose) kinase